MAVENKTHTDVVEYRHATTSGIGSPSTCKASRRMSRAAGGESQICPKCKNLLTPVDPDAPTKEEENNDQ